MNKMNRMLILIWFFAVRALMAGEIPLRIVTAETNVSFTVYASTNALAQTNLSSAAVALDVGTNRNVLVQLKTGTQPWYFYAVARETNGVTSDLSNGLPVQPPSAPEL